MKKVLFTATVDSHILQFHLPFLKLFKDNGYEVHVATNGNETIPYCDVKHVIPFERSPYKINNLKAIKELKKVINEEKYDIIHCHTPMGGVVTRLSAKGARKKYHTRVIYTAHGFHFFKGAPLKNWLIFYPVEKYLSRYTDTLITINNEDYELAKNKFKKCKDVQYVPGVGIDEEKFNFTMTKKEKSELRKSLGLKDDDFVLTCIGRLDKNKNQGFLIEVIRGLVTQFPNIHLLLVGPDEINGLYQEQAKDILNNVHFLGYRSDIPKILKITDISVSSSLREGLPVNILEAMASGVPIVAIDARGVRDLVINEENGYLVDKGNHKMFIDGILGLVTNERLLSIIAKNCFNDIKKYYLSGILNAMAKIYINGSDNLTICTFIHDFRFYEYKNQVYSSGQFSYENFWKKRYLKFYNEVNVIARGLSVNEKPKNSIIIAGNSINFIKAGNLMSFKGILSYFDIKKTIINYCEKSNIIIIRLPSSLGLLAARICRKKNYKYIIEVVGSYYESMYYHGGLISKLLAIPLNLLMKFEVKESQKVLYVTNKYLQIKYPNGNYNIACSDVEINNNIKCIKERFAKIDNYSEKSKYIFGLVGSLNVNYKGHNTAIKIMNILKKKGLNTELHFLGNGNKEKWVKLAQKMNVPLVFDNEKESGIEMENWYKNLDFLLLPSLTEGMPRVLVEALSVGCPVIASNVGDIPYILGVNNTTSPKDAKKYAFSILNYINNNNCLKDYINTNYDKVHNNFSSKLLNEKRNKFYEK